MAKFIAQLLLLINILTLLTSATNCRETKIAGIGPSCWICGKVVNKTPWTLRYTLDPHSGTCIPSEGCCNILNWKTGDGSFDDAFSSSPGSLIVPCHQSNLGAGGQKGGNTCTKANRVDVDAVTFADRDWVVATAGASGKSVTKTKNVKKGVWVKISSMETLTCNDKDGKPYCVGSW